MTRDVNNSNHYIADEGKLLINQNGAFGHEVWLADWDSIENWTEVNEEDFDG